MAFIDIFACIVLLVPVVTLVAVVVALGMSRAASARNRGIRAVSGFREHCLWVDPGLPVARPGVRPNVISSREHRTFLASRRFRELTQH
jgi:hypothetical protein